MPRCHSCQEIFPDFTGLALHISSSKKGHRKGKKWAAKYIMVNRLSGKAQGKFDNKRSPLTETQKESREDSRMVLSGEQELQETICPKCRKNGQTYLPVEYDSGRTAWRINGLIVRTCAKCERVYGRVSL